MGRLFVWSIARVATNRRIRKWKRATYPYVTRFIFYLVAYYPISLRRKMFESDVSDKTRLATSCKNFFRIF